MENTRRLSKEEMIKFFTKVKLYCKHKGYEYITYKNPSSSHVSRILIDINGNRFIVTFALGIITLGFVALGINRNKEITNIEELETYLSNPAYNL